MTCTSARAPILALCGLLLLMAGCVSYESATPLEVSDKVEIINTPYDQFIAFTGPTIRKGWVEQQKIFLRSWQNKESGAFTHQLYVVFWYGLSGYREYYSASFYGGEVTEITRISLDVDCSGSLCYYTETVGAPLSDEDLESARAAGLTVRFNSKSGIKNYITLPPNYVQGYAKTIGFYRREPPLN